jgi:hypothetical protein
MATAPGLFYKFPWEDWGNGKYLLMAPFVAAVVCGYDDQDRWALHVLCIAAMRYLNAQAWQMASRSYATNERTRIQTKLLEFKQVDRERDWDDYIILQSIIMTFVHWYLPGYTAFPLFDAKGFWHSLLFHVGPTEYVYYWFHRALHHHSLFAAYHSHHHASFLTEPISGTSDVSITRYVVRARWDAGRTHWGRIDPLSRPMLRALALWEETWADAIGCAGSFVLVATPGVVHANACSVPAAVGVSHTSRAQCWRP